MKKYHTVEDISEMLQLSKMTIYRYIKSKKLIALKLSKEYRISDREFQKFISENSTKND